MDIKKSDFKIFSGNNRERLESNIEEFKQTIKDKNPIVTIISNLPIWQIKVNYNK